MKNEMIIYDDFVKIIGLFKFTLELSIAIIIK